MSRSRQNVDQLPDPCPGGEDEHGLRGIRRRYPLEGEPLPHDRTELHHVPVAEPAEALRGGPRHGLDEELEPRPGAGRRGDGHERRFDLLPAAGGHADLEVLPRRRVGLREARGVGEVDGDVEDGAVGGGRADRGDGRGRPDGRVLLDGADGGGERAEAAAEGGERAHGERGGGGGGWGGVEVEREAGRPWGRGDRGRGGHCDGSGAREGVVGWDAPRRSGRARKLEEADEV